MANAQRVSNPFITRTPKELPLKGEKPRQEAVVEEPEEEVFDGEGEVGDNDEFWRKLHELRNEQEEDETQEETPGEEEGVEMGGPFKVTIHNPKEFWNLMGAHAIEVPYTTVESYFDIVEGVIGIWAELRDIYAKELDEANAVGGRATTAEVNNITENQEELIWKLIDELGLSDEFSEDAVAGLSFDQADATIKELLAEKEKRGKRRSTFSGGRGGSRRSSGSRSSSRRSSGGRSRGGSGGGGKLSEPQWEWLIDLYEEAGEDWPEGFNGDNYGSSTMTGAKASREIQRLTR